MALTEYRPLHRHHRHPGRLLTVLRAGPSRCPELASRRRPSAVTSSASFHSATTGVHRGAAALGWVCVGQMYPFRLRLVATSLQIPAIQGVEPHSFEVHGDRRIK